MKNLWAPWRMSYLQGETDTSDECIFCRVLREKHDTRNLILYRNTHAYILLNRYPYTNGHMMIVPVQHVASLEDLDIITMESVGSLTQLALKTLRLAYDPEGFNVGINIGEAAGAGVPGHVHTHIVPRWMGDTNFMTSLAETRVLPETLDVTHKRLTKLLNELR